MKNFLVISHIDLDGYSASFLMEKYLRDCYPVEHIDFINVDYGEIDKFIMDYNELYDEFQYDKIFILDLNLTPIVAKFFNKYNVELLDHHISGKNVAEKYDWYHLDTSMCATKIVFTKHEAYLNLYRHYVDFVNAADIFDQSKMNIFRVGRLFAKMQKEVEKGICSVIQSWDEYGEGLNKYKKYDLVYRNFIQSLVDTCLNYGAQAFFDSVNPHVYMNRKSDVMNKTLSPAYKKILSSVPLLDGINDPMLDEWDTIIIGNNLLNDIKMDGLGNYKVKKVKNNENSINIFIVKSIELDNMSDIAKYIMSNGHYQIAAFYEDNTTWSLYSNGDYDVSAFCKKFGGGGHKCAAGMTCGKGNPCFDVAELILEIYKFYGK